MCEFVSWKNYEDHVYFLVDSDLDTKRGRELLAYLGDKREEDLPGHGAIEYYYPELKGKGKNCECTDFSTQKNFPAEIRKEIKAGKMSLIGFNKNLLNKKGNVKYEEARATAWKAYEEAKAPAWKAYEEAKATALKAYEEATATALKAYEEATADRKSNV